MNAYALNAAIQGTGGAPAALGALLVAHEASLSHVNLATACHQLARRGGDHDPPRLTAAAAAALERSALWLLPTMAPREVSATAWAVAKSGAGVYPLEGAFVHALFAACAREAGTMDGRGVSNTLWALATLGAGEQVAALAALVAGGRRLAGMLKSQELANLAWAAATLRVRDVGLLRSIAASARALLSTPVGASSCTGQGLAMLCWAFAKLKTPEEALFTDIAAAAVARLRSNGRALDAQSLVNLLWAFSALGIRHEPLTEAVCAAAALVLPSFTTGAVTTLLWSISTRDAMTLSPPPPRPITALLARRAAAMAAHLSGKDLGLLAAALTRAGSAELACGGDGSGAECLLASLCARARLPDVVLPWRSIAHIDLAQRSVRHSAGCPHRADEAVTGALIDRLSAAMVDMAKASDESNAAPCVLFVSLVSSGRLDLCMQGNALVIGADPRGRVAKAVGKARAGLVHHWRRFASEPGGKDGADAAPWPEGGAGSAGLCAVRFPGAGLEAFRVAQTAAGEALADGGTLFVFGRGDEGCALAPAASILAALFQAPAIVEEAGGCIVLRAVRRPRRAGSGKVPDALAALAHVSTLELTAPGTDDVVTLPAWTTYPAGLFAGGGLDVMTSALLSLLQPPRRGRVLDFASGSGTIAAALHASNPRLRVHMLDADALAMRAAAVNVPGARCHTRDGWPSSDEGGSALRPGSHAFCAIVSNPPVHAGQPDDFRVLDGLVRGAPSRLKPGGSLHIVAQEQIPVGVLLHATGAFAAVTARRPAGGRFVVWLALTPADGAEEEEELPMQAGKRRRGAL